MTTTTTEPATTDQVISPAADMDAVSLQVGDLENMSSRVSLPQPSVAEVLAR